MNTLDVDDRKINKTVIDPIKREQILKARFC